MDWGLIFAILVLVGLSIYYSVMSSNMMRSFMSNPFGAISGQLAPSTGQIIMNSVMGIVGAIAVVVVIIRGKKYL